MRKHYLDNVRWFTVAVVVLYHVFYMYNGVGVLGGLGKITALETQYYDLFLYLVYPWIMPVLFLVSGVSARCALERGTERAFLRSRTRKLLVPSTLGLVVFQFVQGYVSMALSDAHETLKDFPPAVRWLIMVLSGSGVLWYIQMLWLFSLALLAVRRLEKDRLWSAVHSAGQPLFLFAALAMTAVVWAGAQVLNTPVVVVYRFGLYGVVFFAGYFLFSHDGAEEMLKKYFPLFLALAVLTGAAFCFRYFGSNYARRKYLV